MTDGLADKRRFQRIDSENPVLLKKAFSRASERFVKTRVIGVGGCTIVTDEFLGIGSKVELLITVSGHLVKTAGRVVYEILKGSKSVEVGIEFLELAASDRAVIESLFTVVNEPSSGGSKADASPIR